MLKDTIIGASLALVIAFGGFALSEAIAARGGVDQRSDMAALNLTRAGVPATSALFLTCTDADDCDSGDLATNTVYVLVCDVATAIRFASSACTADDSADMLWPGGIPFFFATGGSDGIDNFCGEPSTAATSYCQLQELK